MSDTLVTGQDSTDAGGQQGADSNPQSQGNPNPNTPADSAKPADAQPNADAGKPGDQGQGDKPNDNDNKNAADEVSFEFKLPDGVELDQASADEFTAIFKDKNLKPSEQAQKLADLAVKREVARIEEHKRTVGEWVDTVKADKDIGGDKLPDTLATAKKAIELGPPGLKELLNVTGLGNHPDVVRWAFNIGKALSEDRFVGGSGAQAPKGDMADRLYGNTKA